MEKVKNFEKAMKELEDLVAKLEQGELTLEESLHLFEQGIKLSRSCSKMLDDAEQKVNILVKDKNGEIIKQPFKIDGEE